MAAKLQGYMVVSCLAATMAVGAPKVVLIAGPITGHPKDTHEYEKNVILLKHLLDQSGKVTVEAHFRGWPENEATLDTAATIFFTSDGTDRKEADHPLYVGERIKVIEKQMKRGCGLIFYHWSTFAPKRFDDQITEWIGGYFDYETGPPPRNWYSAIQTWEAEAFPASPTHPITRGVKRFRQQEEFYYRMRFRGKDPRLIPIILTRPPKEDQDYAVGWAVERSDGGRGFGFTGGHFYQNWWSTDFRKVILNAIFWTAKLEVPAEGVESKLEERAKVLIVGTKMTRLAFALEQDPRIVVHIFDNPPPSLRDYKLALAAKDIDGLKTLKLQPDDTPDSVRLRCAAALDFATLSFEPPTNLVEFAIPRSGSQWMPKN